MYWTKVAAVGLAIGLAGCGGEEAPVPKADRGATVRVSTVAASEVMWAQSIEAPGTVRARSTATLSARVPGYVREVRPREGDRVTAGQVVVTLEAREMSTAREQAQAAVAEARAGVPEAESAIASAQAQLELAQVTHRRMQELLSKRSVSQHEFDQVAAQLRVAESGKAMAEAKRRQLDEKIRQAERVVDATETQLSYLEVHAPFAGRVVKRIAEPGTLASPGMPLLEIETDGGFRLEVAVPEAQLSAVRRGQSVEVRLDAIESPITGTVDEIVPELDAATRSLIVKITLPARAEVRGGLFGRALFRSGERTVLTVPAEAIGEQGQLRNVMVAEGGTARLRMVRVGEQRDGQVEILAGLAKDERMIVPRPAGLSDGARVEVAP